MREKLLKVWKNASWSALAQLGEKALRFLSLPLLLWVYGRENFGLIAIVLAIRGYLGVLAMGMPSGIVRFAALWLQTKDIPTLTKCSRTVLSFYLLIGVANALVCVGLAVWGAELFKIDPGQKELLSNMFFITAAYVLLFWPMQLVPQLLEGAEEIHFVQKCYVGRSVVEFLWVLLVVYWHVRLDVYLAVRLIITLCATPFMLARLARLIPVASVFHPAWYWSTVRPIVVYGLGAFAIGVFHTSFLELRIVFLGIRSPSIGAVTDFAVIAALVNVLLMAGGWVVRPLIPSASKALAANDHRYVDLITYQGTKYFWSFITLPLVLIVVNASAVLRLYAGNEFVNLAPWLILLSCAAIDSYLAPLQGVIFATGKLRPFVWSNAVLCVLGLVMVWFGAPALGVGSAVVATLVYWVCQLGYHHLYYLPRVLRIDSWRLFISGFLRPSLAACGTCVTLLVFNHFVPIGSPWLCLITNVVIGALVHVSLIYWLSMDSQDRKDIRGMCRRRLNPQYGVNPA